ncbi:MICOS complex subunit mic60 [Malassezia psittaci]|uniref:MICOS complex subunit MIC60 n=1 Tax=Malassezia psittaci TaxID=1821823 RepID=A0AAF0JFL0_9BASI|nr:MICOS complex subunit mic60 [Malassezia psittaci]
MSRTVAVMLTPSARAQFVLRASRRYSSAAPPPGKTPVPPPPVQPSAQPSGASTVSNSAPPNVPSTAPPGAPPLPPPGGSLPPPSGRRRGGLGKAVWYSLLSLALFYGGSIPASKYSKEYRDFFTERVYGGSNLLSYFEQHDFVKELESMHLDDKVTHAAHQVRSGISHLSDRMHITDHVQHTREEVEKRAEFLQQKVQEQLEELKSKASEEGHVLEKQIQELRANSSEWLEQATELAETKLKQVGQRATHYAHEARDRLPEEVRNAIPLPERAVEDGPNVYRGEIPVDFMPPEGYIPMHSERKLQAPSPKENKARLRPDPQAPKLPQLAPSLSKLGGSEPIVSQLASTIDELANYVRETPSAGAVAKGVLESAQVDLQQLVTRLDQIKKSDAKKLDEQLAKQAKQFEKEIAQKAEQASSALDKRDKDWTKKLEAIQNEQTAQFKGRLAKELETQSAIINERLREEVLAQGIELQRKWSKEIKAKVEQERAGRLARLDELASELHRLESVSIENAKTLDDNVDLHALSAALRQVRQAINGSALAGEEANAYVRRTFSKEFDMLRNTSKAKDNDLIGSALMAIELTGTPREGVESEPTLTEWFSHRLAPRLRSVALLPEQGAGVLSYLTSMMLSPVLFSRRGLVPGKDVASTVARAEWFLDHQDLDSAARELNQLTGWAKILATDWLEEARKRLEVDQALDLIEKESDFATLLKT